MGNETIGRLFGALLPAAIVAHLRDPSPAIAMGSLTSCVAVHRLLVLVFHCYSFDMDHFGSLPDLMTCAEAIRAIAHSPRIDANKSVRNRCKQKRSESMQTKAFGTLSVLAKVISVGVVVG